MTDTIDGWAFDAGGNVSRDRTKSEACLCAPDEDGDVGVELYEYPEFMTTFIPLSVLAEFLRRHGYTVTRSDDDK